MATERINDTYTNGVTKKAWDATDGTDISFIAGFLSNRAASAGVLIGWVADANDNVVGSKQAVYPGQSVLLASKENPAVRVYVQGESADGTYDFCPVTIPRR